MTLKVQDWLWKYYTKENSDSSIKCNYCEKIFSTCQKQSLKYHLGNHEITELDEHPERDSILNYYKKSKLTAECNLCKKIFDLSIHDVRSLKKHIANHPSLKCEYFVKDNIAMCIKCNLQKHLVHPSFRCEYVVKDNIAMCIKCNKILRLTSNSSENLQTECRCRYYSKSDSDPESNDNLHKTLIESTKETKTNDTKKRKTDNVDIKKTKTDNVDIKKTKTDNVDTKKRKTDNADTKKRKTDNADTTKRKTDNADTTKRKTDNADTKKRKTNNADTKKRKTDITDTKKRKTDIVDKCHTSLESNEDLPETIVISEAKETILDLTKKETGVINKNASNTSTKKEDFHDTMKSQLKIQIKEKVQLKKVILIIGRKSGP